MKMSEIIIEDTTDSTIAELAPYGGLGRLATGIGAKLGMQSAQAASDVGTRANQIFKTYHDWALRSGVDLKNVPVTDLNKWLVSQKLPQLNATTFPPTINLNLTDNNKVQQVFKSAAQQAYAKGGATGAALGSQFNVQQPATSRAATTNATQNPVNQINTLLGTLTPAQLAQIKTIVSGLA